MDLSGESEMAKLRANTILACSALLAGGFLAGGIAAETLEMEGVERGDSSAYEQSGRPTRGMTQARVEQRYGAPQKMDAAVGDPPISRWHYAEFVVYFEYDRVIHAVTRR
jgi:hypothetical protein